MLLKVLWELCCSEIEIRKNFARRLRRRGVKQ